MAKFIQKSAIEFWGDPAAAQVWIDEHNELVKSHNDLCQAHDELVEQFKEVASLVDTLMDTVFAEGPSELDS